MKACNRCKRDYPATREFWYADSRGADGLRQPCKECTKAAVAENYSTNKEHYNRYSKQYRKDNAEQIYRKTSSTRFNVELDEINALLDNSDGLCEICKKVPARRLNIDHDHATGELRGLLCGHCNKAIGYMNDNPESLRAAAEYLESKLDSGIGVNG